MLLRNTLLSVAASLLILLLGACSTPAVQPAPADAAPASPAPPARWVVVDPVLPAGVSISPPQTGDNSVAFAQSRRDERTFPNNAIGANLAFTSNLRMPKLEAVELDGQRFQLRMRFSNASKAPLFVSVVCTYEGDSKAARSVRQVEFPVNTFRDIALDLDGSASRKVNIRASAVAAASH